MSLRKVAIIGARGVANYGGFETIVGQLAPGLVAKGYEVYCSHRRSEGAARAKFEGASILYFPFRFPKSNKIGRMFEILYDWYFAIRCAFFMKCDTICCLGIAAGPILWLVRLSGARIAVNLDGLEWKRQKFHLLEKTYIQGAFLASCIWAHHLIIDNSRLASSIPEKYIRKSVFIPYGVTDRGCRGWDLSVVQGYLEKDGSFVMPGRYWLVVARLEPENNVHTIVAAYSKSESKVPLVIVGDYSSPRYEEAVEGLTSTMPKGKSVLFTGSIFNQDHLDMLRCNCLAYLHGHSVGGTNPSLLEAMSSRNMIVAHDNVFNREVANDCALYFKDSEDLARLLDSVENHRTDFAKLGEKAFARVESKYRWAEVVEAYYGLFEGRISVAFSRPD